MDHDGNESPLPLPRLRLLVRVGEKSASVPLGERGVLSLGRSVENAIHVDDVAISHQHVQFHVNGDSIEVEDLGSVNGTLLSKRALARRSAAAEQRLMPYQRWPLAVGDTLQVGPARITLEVIEHALPCAPEAVDEFDSSDFDDPTLVRAASLGRSGSVDSERVDRLRVMRAIETCSGDQTRAALLLGVSRQALCHRLETWNLPRPRKR